ncbi:MAG TPA: hypothetical protein VFQ35_21915 [Polyangiaceae bacterium]|nr:hypothetical protein [Polyangiaceae bacterium]
MNAAVPEQARPTEARAPAVDTSSSVTASGFAALSLCAILAARGLAPALPGTATGIARLIGATVWFAACVSQLVAAGGIALSVRLLGVVFSLPSLGIAFRFVGLGAGLSVITLVAASATRPLDGELGKLLALAAWILPACTLPFVFSRRALRPMALAVSLAVLASGVDLVAYEAARRATASDGLLGPISLALSMLSLMADAATAVFSARALSSSFRRARTPIVIALALTVLALVLARVGSSHTAPTLLVLVQRFVEALSPERPAISDALQATVAVFSLMSVAALLVLRRGRHDVRAALSLMLLARTCAPTPIAALLSITSALLIARAVNDPHLVPERETAKSMN